MKETLQEWISKSLPVNKEMVYSKPASNQAMWVRDRLSWMAYNTLTPKGSERSFDSWEASVTVDGTHVSKSIELPVYRFDVNGVTTKVRGNFHDWCARCYTPLKREFPDYIKSHMGKGFFEGMEVNDSPVSFCMNSREELYSALWWLYSEGI